MACVNGNAEELDYKWLKVQGTQCVVWQFDTKLKNPKKESERRKNIKDKVGKLHTETVMLDSKGTGTLRAFCDGIIYSDNILLWDESFKEFYANFDHKVKSESVGHQRIISEKESGVIYLAVSFYVKTRKVMVQPGQKEEANLLKWVNEFPLLKAVYSRLCKADGNERGGLLNPAPHQGEPQGADEISLPSANPQVHPSAESSTPSNSQSDIASAKSSTVPPVPPESANLQAQRSDNDLGDQQSGANCDVVIVNELLCYIQNRINVLPFDHVVKLCTDFYSEEVITSSKQLLFSKCQGKTQLRLIKRSGENKAKADVTDTIQLLLSLQLCDIPIFAARDLGNLPPLSANDFDIVRILQDIQAVKQSVSLLTQSQSDIVKLVQSKPVMQPVTQTAAPLHLNTSPDSQADVDPFTRSENEDDKFVTLDYTSCSDQSIEHTSVAQASSSGAEVDNDNNLSLVSSNSATPSLSDDLMFAQAAAGLSYSQVLHHTKRSTQDSKGVWKKKGDGRRPHTHSAPYVRHSSPSPNHHRKKSGLIYGSGQCTNVKAVGRGHSSRYPRSNPNRTITGVFITRLDPATTTRQLYYHVKQETGLSVNPEKLDTKFSTYSSFYMYTCRQKH